MELATLLKRERERLGLSQDDLAKRVGVTQQAVSRWEEGQSRPRRKQLDALKRVIGGRASQVEQAVKSADVSDLLKSGHITPESDMPSPQTARALQALGTALPPHLQSNVGQALRIGAYERALDYVSEHLVAELVFAQNAPHLYGRCAEHLLPLAVARATNPQRRHVLLVITGDAGVPNTLQPLMLDAAVLGVQIISARSIEDAAAILADLDK